MRQQILAGTGFERRRKMKRRERGRPPIGLERMLRVYCLGPWYNLADPSLEKALYDIDAMRRFVRIDLGREAAPDETTICKFRHLQEENDLGAALFAEVNAHLADQGVQVSGGTVVDATVIDAPSSTKNQRGERDPETQQTKKGNQWYLGIKGHFGVDRSTKLVHAVVVTAATTADGSVVGELLRCGETRVWGDKAYNGQREAIVAEAPAVQDHTYDKGHRHRPLTAEQEAANRYKSSVRSKVEHPIGTIKRVFGIRKLRYWGIAKNANRLFVASALSNLLMVRRRLVARRVVCPTYPRRSETTRKMPLNRAETKHGQRLRPGYGGRFGHQSLIAYVTSLNQAFPKAVEAQSHIKTLWKGPSSA